MILFFLIFSSHPNKFECSLDKENDIELKTAALHKQLDSEKAKQVKLHGEINQLQVQLQEAKNGLMAAARLSDQLELNQLTIDKLNNESKFFYLFGIFSYYFILYSFRVCALLYLTSCGKNDFIHHSFLLFYLLILYTYRGSSI